MSKSFLHFFTKILKKYVLFSKTSGIIRLSQMADDRKVFKEFSEKWNFNLSDGI